MEKFPIFFPISRESVSITVYREWLFQQDPLPDGYALTASGLRYLEILRAALQHRHPEVDFYLSLAPGNVSTLVSISDNAVNPRQLFDDVSRLATDIAQHQRDKWLVKSGSEEESSIASYYEGEQADDDNGERGDEDQKNHAEAPED